MTQQFITSGLIQPRELYDLMQSGARVRILDASYVLGGPIPYQPYVEQRIGGAGFFNIDEIADKATSLPHMLPSEAEFGQAVSTLGISNDDLVIVYGQTAPHMGPARAWWTFRVFGHDNVCVLDGGLSAWVAEGLPVNANLPVTPEPGDFKARYRPELVRTLAQMEKPGDALVLDARPAGRFSGEVPEPRPGLSAGHMPGSRNIPAADMAGQDNRMKSAEELQGMFRGAGYIPGKTVYATCGSGVTACMIALALYRLGYKDTAVYDGSWAEWGRLEAGRPVETGAGDK